MKKQILVSLVAAVSALLLIHSSAKEIAGILLTQDLVYAHKHGLAMTLDVLKPQNPNGAVAVFMVSVTDTSGTKVQSGQWEGAQP